MTKTVSGSMPRTCKVPRPTLQGIQAVIDSGMVGKIDIKADRIVDFSIVDELEKADSSIPSTKDNSSLLRQFFIH